MSYPYPSHIGINEPSDDAIPVPKTNTITKFNLRKEKRGTAGDVATGHRVRGDSLSEIRWSLAQFHDLLAVIA